MNDETKAQDEVNAAETNEADLVAQVQTYEAAAALYRDGKREEAIQMIRDQLGDEAADEAVKVMNEVEEVTATDSESAEKTEGSDNAETSESK